MSNLKNLPDVRGTLSLDRPLDSLTWLRVGGPADWFYQPADLADLQTFLSELSPDVAVFPMGVGSNLIVRDGGLRAVVVRLGRGFNGIAIDGDLVTAGAAALDAHVARKAADAGIDLTFLRTIPGSIGGAVTMNAGCYGTYTADVFVSARVVLPGARAPIAARGSGILHPRQIRTEWLVRTPKGRRTNRDRQAGWLIYCQSRCAGSKPGYALPAIPQGQDPIQEGRKKPASYTTSHSVT